MKKHITRICSVLLLVAMLCLSSCGGAFFEGDEILQIASIESELMEDGQTKITIYYTDDTVDPAVFYLPKGATGDAGKDGNGISAITYEHDANNRQTAVKITYTDATLTPTVFDIPDGLSVVGIVSGNDAVTLAPYIVFRYSDGSLSDPPVYLPKGDKGNGIKVFEVTPNEDDHSVSIHIELDDATKSDIYIPGPQTGNGIAGMSAATVGDQYVLTVNYTNGTSEDVYFDRPADPNKWLVGQESPSPFLGENGDFFFDEAHKVIWSKSDDSWHKIISFQDETTTYTVSFDLNDEGDAALPQGTRSHYTVARGAYFSADGNGEIPIPTREGYTFLGWYTKRAVNSAIMSPFTDLTAVFSDLTLYACWEANA